MQEISFDVTEEEKRFLEEVAKMENLSVEDFVRQSIFKKMEEFKLEAKAKDLSISEFI